MIMGPARRFVWVALVSSACSGGAPAAKPDGAAGASAAGGQGGAAGITGRARPAATRGARGDGTLYFAEADANKIGRITPPGTSPEFPTATPTSYPSYLTPGPDRNVCSTEAFGKVGFITPAGTITEYTCPTAGSGPVGITVGP